MEIKIRSWSMEDSDDLAEVVNNKKIHDNLRDGLPFPYTVNDAKEFINSMINIDKNDNFPFAITDDNKVIGSIGAYRKSNIHYRTAEVGYYISEKYWGKGITSIALTKLCDYIFTNTNIVRIFAEPFSKNIASCKVLEKSGFVFEGILRKNAEKNGELLNMSLYSIIKEDWNK